MPIAVDMKNITEGIEISYGERVAFLSDLFKDTNDTLKTFHRQYQKMSTDLWDSLSSDRDNRKNMVAALRGKNKRELRAMAEQVANFLKESTSGVKKDTAALMGQIRGFIELVEKENTELKKDTGNLLSSFHYSHKARSSQLKRELSSCRKDLTSSVRGMRNANCNDQKEAKSHWQNLVKIMAAKRVGKVVTAAKKIDRVPKEEVAEAVEAFTVGSLKEQILRLISEAASGITLTKMGKALGIPYVRLAKPTSELVKEGKIEKEDSQYFKI